MSYISTIQLYNLCYTPAGRDKPLFQDINLIFGAEKIGLVGRNGVGKSSLLKLIADHMRPSQGRVVSSNAKIAFQPQELSMND